MNCITHTLLTDNFQCLIGNSRWPCYSVGDELLHRASYTGPSGSLHCSLQGKLLHLYIVIPISYIVLIDVFEIRNMWFVVIFKFFTFHVIFLTEYIDILLDQYDNWDSLSLSSIIINFNMNHVVIENSRTLFWQKVQRGKIGDGEGSRFKGQWHRVHNVFFCIGHLSMLDMDVVTFKKKH